MGKRTALTHQSRPVVNASIGQPRGAGIGNEFGRSDIPPVEILRDERVHVDRTLTRKGCFLSGSKN